MCTMNYRDWKRREIDANDELLRKCDCYGLINISKANLPLVKRRPFNVDAFIQITILNILLITSEALTRYYIIITLLHE